MKYISRLFPISLRQSAVMFHFGRSGSQVLGNLLLQHSQIDWRGEMVREKRVKEFKDRLKGKKYSIQDHVKAIARNRNKKLFGFETKFFHLRKQNITIAEFVTFLKQNGCKRFITLKRENILRKIASSSIAKNKRAFHQENKEKAKLTKIHLDPSEIRIDGARKPLVEMISDYENDFKELNLALENSEVLRLTYEEHIKETPLKAYEAICNFLGTKSESPDIQYGKSNPFPLSEIIENFDEIKNELKGTPHSWMTDDSNLRAP